MRIPRRGTIAQRKGGGYVWAVYSLAPGVDESVFTTGSFTMTASFSSTPYLMAADSYTVDSSGTITLTSATRTNVSALAAGKYIVSISSSSSTATTSTQYVYKVTGVTSSGSTWSTTYTVSYERYEVSLAGKGDDTGNRVESADSTAYPHNGVQGNYWYVLLRGWVTIYVWEVYNLTYGINLDGASTSGSFTTGTGNSRMASRTYTVGSDGKVTLLNAQMTRTDELQRGDYVVDVSGGTANNLTSITGNYLYRVTENTASGSNQRVSYSRYTPTQTYKGEYTGNQKKASSFDYPENGIKGGYWYVYIGAEEVYIDNT